MLLQRKLLVIKLIETLLNDLPMRPVYCQSKVGHVALPDDDLVGGGLVLWPPVEPGVQALRHAERHYGLRRRQRHRGKQQSSHTSWTKKTFIMLIHE